MRLLDLDGLALQWSHLSAIGRAAAVFVVWVALWLPIAIPLAIKLRWQPRQPIAAAQKLPLLASLYGIAPLVLWGTAVVEGKAFTDYGLSWQPSVLQSFYIGLLVGVLGLMLLFAIETGCGWIKFQLADQPFVTRIKTLLVTLALGVWVSATEELIFRGFLLNELLHDYSAWIAAAIASLVFALLHLVWEGQENVPQLPGLWLMGMVLVLARWLDSNALGLAWGLHAGWVWAIASLDATAVIDSTGRVPQWLTGLGNKPLAGAIGILFLGATAALLWRFF
jgi:hypothetical protein